MKNKTKPISVFEVSFLIRSDIFQITLFCFILLLSMFLWAQIQSRINGIVQKISRVCFCCKTPPFSFLFLFFIFEKNFPLPHIALNSYLAYEIPLCSSCTAGVSLMCPLSWTTFQAKLAGETNPYNDWLVFLFFFFLMEKCLVPISSLLVFS